MFVLRFFFLAVFHFPVVFILIIPVVCHVVRMRVHGTIYGWGIVSLRVLLVFSFSLMFHC